MADLPDELGGAVVTAAQIDTTARSIQVELYAERYIPERVTRSAVQMIRGEYPLREVSVFCRHPADQLRCMEPEELRDLFVREDPMARGSLAGAIWAWEDRHLTVRLKGNGKKELEASVPKVIASLSSRFGADITIGFVAGQTLEGQALFDALEKMRQGMVEDLPDRPVPQQKEAPPAPPSEAIFGKPFRGNVVPMKDLDLNMGNVIVEGRVFAVEHKELPKRNAVVVKFDMTDNT
ncbi:MAG: hypothetical protein IIV61_03275, partial [Oscillospiraceae bacterium]|nr:hypothetical protein [Oscillospiraceae bacterium]